MSDIDYIETERSEKGNTMRVWIAVGGKMGYVEQTRRGVKWRQTEGIEPPHESLVRRAEKRAKQEFSDPEPQFFVRAGPRRETGSYLFLVVHLVRIKNGEEVVFDQEYGMHKEKGHMFMNRKRGYSTPTLPFTGKELGAMWSFGERKLGKWRKEILFEQQQKSFSFGE